MSNVFIASKEQADYIETLKQKSQAFGENPRLIGVPLAIEDARQAINHAADLGLPYQAYADLQRYVSMYDGDQMLPEHLRRDWTKIR